MFLLLWSCLHVLVLCCVAVFLFVFLSRVLPFWSIYVRVCVCVSGDCPWSTWSGVGSGSVWQRPRPGWLPGEVAYSLSSNALSVFLSRHFHLCCFQVGPWFCQNPTLVHVFHSSGDSVCVSLCLSHFRVKVDLDIVKKARVVDDVSINCRFQPIWDLRHCLVSQQTQGFSLFRVIVSLWEKSELAGCNPVSMWCRVTRRDPAWSLFPVNTPGLIEMIQMRKMCV